MKQFKRIDDLQFLEVGSFNEGNWKNIYKECNLKSSRTDGGGRAPPKRILFFFSGSVDYLLLCTFGIRFRLWALKSRAMKSLVAGLNHRRGPGRTTASRNVILQKECWFPPLSVFLVPGVSCILYAVSFPCIGISEADLSQTQRGKKTYLFKRKIEPSFNGRVSLRTSPNVQSCRKILPELWNSAQCHMKTLRLCGLSATQ